MQEPTNVINLEALFEEKRRCSRLQDKNTRLKIIIVLLIILSTILGVT